MKEFFRRISPRQAALDFAGQWRRPTSHRWPILGVSAAFTFAMFMLFIPPSQRADPPKPEVIWISTWEDGRTKEEIMASNCVNQQRKDEMAALFEARAQLRKDLYAAIGRATFIDVDAIEKQAEAEKKAAEAAARGERPAWLDSEMAKAQIAFCEKLDG